LLGGINSATWREKLISRHSAIKLIGMNNLLDGFCVIKGDAMYRVSAPLATTIRVMVAFAAPGAQKLFYCELEPFPLFSSQTKLIDIARE
jgi:hypothetical protein